MSETLIERLAAAASLVPGVRRLEPSVTGGLRRMVAPRSVVDGVLLVQVDGRLEATVDVSVDRSRSALQTATEVEQALTDLLRQEHDGPVAVTVRVLSIGSG